ncbi:hypothetical protein BXZ70DRAFT_1033918 [Cristinia sonorae]|uniref:DUF6533 domain-containing protein n=1 Tax=Cristinia sonorae TaxID=1940300 RepID=A0A8K0UK70_9AGAR|nr:hypothetical protein BXZ70DRAFT_1033918 [Cristinia sonorae]
MADNALDLKPAEIAALLPTLFAALRQTKYLSIASICLFIYEYFLTLDREIQFFWSGEWSVTRILFFANRYFPPFIFSCTQIFVLVIRCWYLFQDSFTVRYFILASFVACGTTTFVIITLMWHEMKPLKVDIPGVVWDGCMAPLTPGIWRVFVPGIVIHTILYGATTIPALRLKSQGKSSPIMDRLLRDGGAMYLVVFGTVLFTGVGAVSPNMSVSTPAIYSNFLLSATSIAVSRLILSMHSLAANLSLDPKWLLNNAELSRVRWRKGSRDGEIIVEVDSAESEMEMDAVISVTKAQLEEEERRVKGGGANSDRVVGSIRGITTTKYGFYEDLPTALHKGKGDTRP